MAPIQAQVLDLAMRRPGWWAAVVTTTAVLLTLVAILASVAA